MPRCRCLHPTNRKEITSATRNAKALILMKIHVFWITKTLQPNESMWRQRSIATQYAFTFRLHQHHFFSAVSRSAFSNYKSTPNLVDFKHVSAEECVNDSGVWGCCTQAHQIHTVILHLKHYITCKRRGENTDRTWLLEPAKMCLLVLMSSFAIFTVTNNDERAPFAQMSTAGRT